MSEKQIAVVVGAGPGLGYALVRRFAEAGMMVAAVSRKGRPPEMAEHSDLVHGYVCDATVGDQVSAMFARVTAELGPPDLVVYNIGTWDAPAFSIFQTNYSNRLGARAASADFWSAAKRRGQCCRMNAAPSSSAAPPARSAAASDLQRLRSRSSASVRWPRAWRASSGRGDFTLRMSSSTA
jgi:NAD(P)-dependent dehydrogenase (short-subunit alcohol dehydrogenase family)